MEDGWCGAFKVHCVSKERGKQKGESYDKQACMTKKLTELDERVCCEMSGLVCPENYAACIH